MNITAIIHEQIEWDGTAKAFQLKADQSIGDLWIAFPTEYSDERNAPFHFLDKEHETIFHSKIASCRQKKITSEHFYQSGNGHVFKTTWQGIPTERESLTYYALYLPEYAIPVEIKVTDTIDTSRQFSKSVFRDDEKNRYVVYVKCSSKYGQFGFGIYCRFHRDEIAFKTSSYLDDKTVDFYAHLDGWKWAISKDDAKQVEQVFTTNHIYMGDQYNTTQAGAVGPNASATGNTLVQSNYALPADTDYEKLAMELEKLKQLLLTKATNPEHYNAIGEVAKAEEAAKEKDGNKVIKSLKSSGKWVLDIANGIVANALFEIIKKCMGV